MNKRFSWLHLSDLHFQYHNDSFESTFVYDKLLEDLKHIESLIDCVFITGDIAYSGKEEEYKIATEFFHNVSASLNIPKNRFFFVPGNHDILRNDTMPYVTKITDNIRDEKDLSGLLGNKQLLDLFLSKFHNYYAFMKDFIESSSYGLSYTENICINGVDVSVVGLNSAWTSTTVQEKGRILLGERQVLEAYSKIKTPQITFTLLHHPVNYFQDEDSIRVESLINRRSDFVLYGHIHNRKIVTQQMPDSVVHYFGAGASYDKDVSSLAYNYAIADLDSGIISVWLRKYNAIENCWVRDNSYNECGKIQLQLPERFFINSDNGDFTYRGINDAEVKQRLFYMDKEIVHKDPFEIPAIPKLLLTSIQKKECVLFAGAGASMDAKLPSWHELVVTLVRHVTEDRPNLPDYEKEEIDKLFCEKKYLILAEYCLKKMGPYDFSEIIEKKLSCKGKKSLTHDILAQIPFKAILTTNFDNFLEQSNAQKQHFYRSLLPNDMNISEEKFSGILPILKIHGSYETPESIVLTKAGLRDLLFNNPKYNETLKRYFTDNTVLFYGYGFNDPDIDFILQEIMASKKGWTKKHYAILPDVGEIEAEYYLREYNVQVISYKTRSYGHLPARGFLEKIVESL